MTAEAMATMWAHAAKSYLGGSTVYRDAKSFTYRTRLALRKAFGALACDLIDLRIQYPSTGPQRAADMVEIARRRRMTSASRGGARLGDERVEAAHWSRRTAPAVGMRQALATTKEKLAESGYKDIEELTRADLTSMTRMLEMRQGLNAPARLQDVLSDAKVVGARRQASDQLRADTRPTAVAQRPTAEEVQSARLQAQASQLAAVGAAEQAEVMEARVAQLRVDVAAAKSNWQEQEALVKELETEEAAANEAVLAQMERLQAERGDKVVADDSRLLEQRLEDRQGLAEIRALPGRIVEQIAGTHASSSRACPRSA